MSLLAIIRISIGAPTLLLQKTYSDSHYGGCYFDKTTFLPFVFNEKFHHDLFTSQSFDRNTWVLLDLAGGKLRDDSDILRPLLENAPFVVITASHNVSHGSIQQQEKIFTPWYMKPPDVAELIMM